MSIDTLLENGTNIKNLSTPEPERPRDVLIPEPELLPQDWDVFKDLYKENISYGSFPMSAAILSAVHIIDPEKVEFITGLDNEALFQEMKNWYKETENLNALENLNVLVAIKQLFPEKYDESDIKEDLHSKSLEVNSMASLKLLTTLFPERKSQLKEDINWVLDQERLYISSNKNYLEVQAWHWIASCSRLKLLSNKPIPKLSDKGKISLTNKFASEFAMLRHATPEELKTIKDSFYDLLWALRDLHILNASKAYIDENGNMHIENNPKTQLNTIPDMPVWKK